MHNDPNQPYRQYFYTSPRTPHAAPRATAAVGRRTSYQKRRTSYRGRYIGAAIMLLAVLIGLKIHGGHQNTLSSASPANALGTSAILDSTQAASVKKTVQVPSDEELATMATTINGVIDAHPLVDMSVSVINLSSGATQHYGVSDTFLAGSTSKILTAAYYLNQVEAGKRKLTDTVNGASAQANIKQMIVQSDDVSWEALNNSLTYAKLQTYGKGLGMTNIDMHTNAMTSDDMAILLQKLWNGDLLNKEHTDLILDYMKQANFREYVVPAIPSEDTIYHKIGLWEDYVNDATIITHDDQAYALVIYTNGKGSQDWTGRATAMQQIAKATLKAYFQQD